MALEDRMRGWQSEIDREIERALQDADQLPGVGKPLDLRKDENIPDDMRMAFKVLAENDLAPAWIMSAKALEKSERSIRNMLKRGAADYKSGKFANADITWNSVQRKARKRAEKYNREVLTHNLKLPEGIQHKAMMNIEREIHKALVG